jgi:hypothetical protein
LAYFIDERESQNMRVLKLVLSHYFFFLTVISLAVLLGEIRQAMHGQNTLGPRLNPLVEYFVPVLLAVIFGTACWAALLQAISTRVWEWGKIWATLASVLSLLITAGVPVLYLIHEGSRAFWYLECVFGIPTAIGIAGVVAFSRPGVSSAGGTRVE